MCDVITMSTVADVRFLCIRVVYQLSLILGSIIVHLLHSMGCQMHTNHLFLHISLQKHHTSATPVELRQHVRLFETSLVRTTGHR